MSNMFEYFDRDFFKMAEGFMTIIVFALVVFFTLSYMSENEQLSDTINAVFYNLITSD